MFRGVLELSCWKPLHFHSRTCHVLLQVLEVSRLGHIDRVLQGHYPRPNDRQDPNSPTVAPVQVAVSEAPMTHLGHFEDLDSISIRPRRPRLVLKQEVGLKVRVSGQAPMDHRNW